MLGDLGTARNLQESEVPSGLVRLARPLDLSK